MQLPLVRSPSKRRSISHGYRNLGGNIVLSQGGLVDGETTDGDTFSTKLGKCVGGHWDLMAVQPLLHVRKHHANYFRCRMTAIWRDFTHPPLLIRVDAIKCQKGLVSDRSEQLIIGYILMGPLLRRLVLFYHKLRQESILQNLLNQVRVAF
jgi:hypothetical protein